jgi:putative flippase GtrA
LRSGAVGALATLVDLLALWLGVAVLGASPAVANLPALLLGVAVQFAGNKYLAFEDDSPQILRQGGLFAVVEVGSLGLNAVGFHLAVAGLGMPYLFARIICSALVYVGFSYPLWNKIFQPRDVANA